MAMLLSPSAPAPPAASASAATTCVSAKTLSSVAAGPVRFGLRFIHIQSAPTKFRAIQGCYGLFGFPRVRHLDKGKPARASGFTVRDDVYIIHGPVHGKKIPQFRVSCTMRQVADVKVLHCASSLKSSANKLSACSRRCGVDVSGSRVGDGLSLKALVSAYILDRTAEIRRHACMILALCAH